MKDVSNIFKLSVNELELKKSTHKKLWEDTAPEIVDFAKKLQGLLQSVDTPYVIGLDGGYGTGKTHFATRFAAQMHEQIKTIYFSAWEKDYEKEPITVFLEQIVNLIKTDKKYIESSQIKNIKSLLKSLWVAIESVSVNSPITKFPISMTFNVERFRRQLNKLTIKEDMLQNAKRELANYIKSLPHEKMVLIVDDLDRCRPDTAVKILETVKHFFDIDGLIVVMPINQTRLRLYIDAFYGINTISTQNNIIVEDYLQKFFNYILDIPALNYAKVCEEYITKFEFKKNLVYSGNSYCCISELRKWIAEYAKKSAFTYRETVETIKAAKLFCNKYHEPIRCRLLAYTLCNKRNRSKRKININSSVIQYGDNDIYTENGQNPRKLLFEDQSIYNLLNNIVYNFNIVKEFEDMVKNFNKNPKTFTELYDNIQRSLMFLSKNLKQSLCKNSFYDEQVKSRLVPVIDGLKKQKQVAQKLQREHGSDDRDKERQKEYEKIANNPHLLT